MRSGAAPHAQGATPRRRVVPLRAANLAEVAYERLKDDIAGFRLLPGDRFTETEISERVGASRTPVRHALYRLQREGFLDVHFRSGWQVRQLDFEQFDALYELRIVLEVAAIRRLCAEPDVHQALQPLKEAWLIPPAERLQDGRRVAVLDEEFHACLMRAAGNREMVRVHQDVTERIRVIRRLDFTQPARVVITYDEHAGILRAILGRRAADAERLLRAHIEVSRTEVRKITIQRLQAVRRPW